MWAAAHLQQLKGVTVVGHQHLQGWIIHWGIINLDGGQGLGVHKHHCQCRHKVCLRKRKQWLDQDFFSHPFLFSQLNP